MMLEGYLKKDEHSSGRRRKSQREVQKKMLDHNWMAVKSCKVICCDTEDIEHAVSVSAEGFYSRNNLADNVLASIPYT